MNDLYLLCEVRNCSRRAEPGRSFCIVCSNRIEVSWAQVRVRAPADKATMVALLQALIASDEVIRALVERVATRPDGECRPRQMVGWWCSSCRNFAQDIMRPCRCTTKIEDANAYYRFKAEKWRPCFAHA